MILEFKVVIVSSSQNSHYMRRNAVLIESLFEVLQPILNSREVYMNIAYIKGEMIDYMDSPVPYIIGMSDTVWGDVGEKKWAGMALEENDNIVLFRIDLENPVVVFNGVQRMSHHHMERVQIYVDLSHQTDTFQCVENNHAKDERRS